jgi:hypothetical protein
MSILKTPEDGTPMSKHVAVLIIVMSCIKCICWWIYCCKNTRGMNTIQTHKDTWIISNYFTSNKPDVVKNNNDRYTFLDNPEMRGWSLYAKETIFNFRFRERQTASHEAISQLYGQSSFFQTLGFKNQVNSRGRPQKACLQPLPHDRRGSQATFMPFQLNVKH